MRTERRGAAIAGVSGALLLVSMFLDWYSAAGAAGELIESVNEVSSDLGGPSEDVAANAWEAFSFIDVVIALAAAMALITAAVVLSKASVSFPIAGSSVTAGLGGVAFLLILYRALNPPGDGDVDRDLGLWLGLLASAGAAYGGWVGMQEQPSATAGRP